MESHGALCPSCWGSIDFIGPPLCNRLGIPLPYDSGEIAISAAAFANPPVYHRARAVAHYDGVMRDMIHNFKYADRHEAVDLFGRWLAYAGRDILEDADLLIPVPLYRLRLWARRFNQAAILADGLARLSGITSNPFCLTRVRQTRSQVGLTADQRKRNVAGAFHVPKASRAHIQGRNIVLVDDVITTGATAEACAKVLINAGAVQVDVLALARVVNPLTATY